MRLLLIRSFWKLEKSYFHRTINENLGIEYLASYLKKTDHQVKILDAIASGWNKFWLVKNRPNLIYHGLTPEDILKEIKNYQPDVIGLSLSFATQSELVCALAKIIKERNPNIILIVGGPQASSNPRQTLLENSCIDIVVSGEGEETLKELLDKKCQDLKNILGIAFRYQGLIKVNGSRPLLSDINEIPLPARMMLPYVNYSKQQLNKFVFYYLEKIFKKYNLALLLAPTISQIPLLDRIYFFFRNKKRKTSYLPSADIITSRGCPNECTFCAIRHTWGRSWRARTAQNVLKEIDDLVKNYRIKHIVIRDENFIISKKRVIEICKGVVQRNYSLTFWANVYPIGLDREVLSWLKKAGFHSLRLSIESGSQRVLNEVIKKRINLNEIKTIVDNCRELNIKTEGVFMFGLPGETIEEMKKSIKFSKEMGFDERKYFIFQPYPNTELYKVCVEKGYLTDDYSFQQTYVTGDKCFVKTEDFNPEDVLRVLKRGK